MPLRPVTRAYKRRALTRLSLRARVRAVARKRRNLSAFDDLQDTPDDLEAGITLPANGVLFVSTDSALATHTPIVVIGARTLSAPAGAANLVRRIGYFERGAEVTMAPGAPGTVSLYVEGSFGVPILIAQGDNRPNGDFSIPINSMYTALLLNDD